MNALRLPLVGVWRVLSKIISPCTQPILLSTHNEEEAVPKFHIDASTGDAITCRLDTCSRATHFATAEDARSHFEKMKSDFVFSPLRKPVSPPARPTRDLNTAFAEFLVSAARSAPVKDRGDWRGRQEDAANANGDAYADANPDTSFTSKYADYTPEDDDEPMPDLL